MATIDNGDRFGAAVSDIGDVDGDGITDIAVGAELDSDSGANSGAVYILFLNADGTVKAEQKISSIEGGLAASLDAEDRFGSAIAGLGDVDKDGTEDIAIGVSRDDDGGPDRGAVYLLFLNPDGTVKTEQKISSTSSGFVGPLVDDDNFGKSVASLGDLDGDGAIDIAIGATLDDDGKPEAGAVYVLNLAPTVVVNNAPTFLASGPFNVDEGAVATTVVGNIDADDGDGGAADTGITYSITSNVNPDADGNDAFAIDSSSGQITVNDAGDLDFEGATPLVITVQADDGVQTSATSVTVNLNDVAPTLTVAGAGNISVGQTYLLDLTATEPGTSGITSYTVNWGDGNVTTEAYTGPTTSVSHVYDDVGFTYHITFAAHDVSDTWTASDLIVPKWKSGTDNVFVIDGVSGDVNGIFDSTGGDLERPYGITVGPDGNFYVSGYDSDSIVSFTADGSYIGIFSAHAQLNKPEGLAWGSDGNLYVANYGDNNILRFDAAGTFIDVWGVGGTLNGPDAVAFSPDGDLYVSSWGNKKVVMFDGVWEERQPR